MHHSDKKKTVDLYVKSGSEHLENKRSFHFLHMCKIRALIIIDHLMGNIDILIAIPPTSKPSLKCVFDGGGIECLSALVNSMEKG